MNLAGRCTVLRLGLLLGGCAYTGTMVRQTYYRAQLRGAPRAAVYKHMLDRQTHFVFGEVLVPEAQAPLAVLAVTQGAAEKEVVDVSHGVRATSFYGLNLPPSEYELLAVRDLDADGFYRGDEVVGETRLVIPAAGAAEKVIGYIHLRPGRDRPRSERDAFTVPVRTTPPRVESVVYPKGTLRSLEDPLFDPEMATLGLYQPAAFMEQAPMMFYALEEDAGHKVPVIFVHGIDGTPRDFEPVLQQLDRTRYRAWFYYYPSGGSLDQLGQLFYEIFLSGRTVPRVGMPVVIVAHSMGGLVVREALNRHRGTEREQIVGSFITVASPMGGHPAARRSAHGPVVLPSWRDLDPSSPFIRNLHRNPLPRGLSYHLYYAFGDTRAIKLGAAGDGVVPLESQLDEAAQREATEQHGFNAGHTEVLRWPESVKKIAAAIQTVKSVYPEDHLRILDQGGYDLPLDRAYTPMEAYLVRSIGRYMDALVGGELQPIFPEQKTFIEACRGTLQVDWPAVSAWRKMNRMFPHRRTE